MRRKNTNQCNSQYIERCKIAMSKQEARILQDVLLDAMDEGGVLPPNRDVVGKIVSALGTVLSDGVSETSA